jgi:hypothetical protein
MSDKRKCNFCINHIPSLTKQTNQTNHTTENCPFRMSVKCLKCCMKGHLTAECSMEITWKRPHYLEDLISDEDKKRWQITTRTPILHTPLTPVNYTETALREISKTDTMRVINQDKKIRDFMRTNGVKTVHEQIENMRILTEWAIQQGKRIEFVKETAATSNNV